jgi:nitrate/nitrite-specific signal transduction histidine kinase
MGLNIMEYRARMIGADLKITRREPRGTRVRCVVGISNVDF